MSLATGRILINVTTGELIMRVNNKLVVFNIFKAMVYSKTTHDYFAVNIIKQIVIEVLERSQFLDPVQHILTSKYIEEEENEDLAKLMV